MKKIFTLVAGMLLTAAVFAADRKPVVTVKSSKNYKIVIDGKSYFGDNLTLRLDDNFKRSHTIKVFEMRRGLFVNREKMVDAAVFQLDRNDVAISIDWAGNIKIREMKGYGHFGRDGRDDYGYDNGFEHGRQNDQGRRF
jgi:hypothetical protein